MRKAAALPWKHRAAPSLFSSPLNHAWTFLLSSFRKESFLEVELALVCEEDDRKLSGDQSIGPGNNKTRNLEGTKGTQSRDTNLPGAGGIKELLSLGMNFTAEHREAVQSIREK